MNINKTDLRLILELQRNGATSYAELAERLHITPQTVAKRVEGLTKSKVISIRALPNPFKLGFRANALIAIKTDPAKIDHVCEKLSESFHVNLVQTVFGRFDILAMIYYSNWELLHDFINNKLSTIDGVTHVETFFINKILKRYDKFFEEEPYPKEPIRLKDTDWRLIEELVKDGRASTGDLAEKLGIHVTTVYRRTSALIKEQIIKISAVPNPSRFGYSASAFIALDVAPTKVDFICEDLSPYSEIHRIMTMINGSRMIVYLHTRDLEALFEFIKKKIAPLEGIINTETFISAMVQKTYYGLLMEEDDVPGQECVMRSPRPACLGCRR